MIVTQNTCKLTSTVELITTMSWDKKSVYDPAENEMKSLDDHLDASTEYRGKVSEVIIICFVRIIMYS